MATLASCRASTWRKVRSASILTGAKSPAGTRRVTTLPAPISASSPMETPGKDDRPRSDPDIAPDADRAAKLQAEACGRVSQKASKALLSKSLTNG